MSCDATLLSVIVCAGDSSTCFGLKCFAVKAFAQVV